MSQPLTFEEAQEHRYGCSDVRPQGFAFNPRHCAFDTPHSPGYPGHQCQHNIGHGPGNLYCPKHAELFRIGKVNLTDESTQSTQRED